MTEFCQRLILFLRKGLPAGEEAREQGEALPELTRLQRTRAMIKSYSYAQFYSRGKGTT